MHYHCPNCGAYCCADDSEDVPSQGCYRYYYVCDDCECEFQVEEHTSYEVEVSKEGKPQ